MIHPLWRNDSTFYQTVHTQARFLTLARLPHLNDWVNSGELEIFAKLRIQTHNVDILDSLNFVDLIE